MECTRAEELVSLELDGEASPDQRRELESHLAGCARCRDWRARQLRIHAALDSALGGLTAAVVPPAPPARRFWRRPLAWAAAAALLAAAAGAGYAWGRRGSGPPGGTAPPLAERGTRPAAYLVRTERSLPVREGLVWDRAHGLRSEKHFDNHRVHTVRLPDGGELEWTTDDHEVRLVSLEGE
jgi:anti-sigma factor RsiW